MRPLLCTILCASILTGSSSVLPVYPNFTLPIDGIVTVTITKTKPKEIHCLATMVYGEARSESEKGQIAVAFTAINRAKKNNRNICDVVLQPFQYSIFNDNEELQNIASTLNTNPSLNNIIDIKSWDQAVQVAEIVYNNNVKDITNGATHYYAEKVMIEKKLPYPKWIHEFEHLVTIENHKFFKQKEKNV